VLKEVTATGKDVAEAKENARLALGADELADVKYEILHAGSHGIFGLIGVKPAQVKATIELPDMAPRARQNRAEKKQNENTESRADRADNRNRHNGKPSHRSSPAIPPQSKSAPKKRSEVIPEAEIKLEPREAQPGEDRALDFVNALINNMGITATAALYTTEDGGRRIIISGEDASVLIGHHGDTLDSLQYLTTLASAQLNSKGEKDHSRVTIDIEGYRAKREDALRALARRTAGKALRNKRNIMLEPMNPYERRIIHDEVSGIEGVTTASVGSDNSRRVVIYFDKASAPKEAPEEKAEVTVEPIANEMPVASIEASAEGADVADTETVDSDASAL
jgi:spoIIIJ-associated protein